LKYLKLHPSLKGSTGTKNDILEALTYIEALEVTSDKLKIKKSKSQRVESLNSTCQELGVDPDKGIKDLSVENFKKFKEYKKGVEQEILKRS
jgi:UDP-N-acetylglucosamine enolpyruvyl transferase